MLTGKGLDTARTLEVAISALAVTHPEYVAFGEG